MADHKQQPAKQATAKDKKEQPAGADQQSRKLPKPESSSEYEGAPNRKPTGNPGDEVKTETSSTSGQ
jgi:hypothetical protein